MGQGNHDVDPDDTLGLFPGLQNFLFEGADISAFRVLGHILVQKAYHGSGNDAYAAFIGDGRGQS